MTQNAAKNSAPRSAWFNTSKGRCVFAMLVGCVVTCLILCLANVPVRYDIQVGQEAHETIPATKDVTDETSLKAEQEKAADLVLPYYTIPREETDRFLAELTAVLDQLQQVQASRGESKGAYSDHELAEAREKVTRFSLNNNNAQTLLNMSDEDFAASKELILSTAGDYLRAMESVQDSTAATVAEKIRDQITARMLEQGRSEDLLKILTDPNSLTADGTQVLTSLLKAFWTEDSDATARAKQAARDRVEEKKYFYKQSDVIIRAGDIVQQNQYDMLASLYLLKDSPIDASIYYGAILFGLTGYGLLTVLALLLSPALFSDLRRTIVLNCVIVLAIGLCVVAVKLNRVYLSPVILAALLCTSLLGWRTAIAANVSIAVMLASLAAGDSSTSLSEMVCIILMTLVSGTFAIVFVRHRYQRVLVLACGFVCGLLNGLVLLMMSLLTTLLPEGSVTGIMNSALFALAGAVLSAVIAVAFQPIFESVFNLPTGNKLLELTNPNHPLLKKLMMEAPGTYHHSIIVANLAEAAAENIGANPLLARAGAYFHDVGKLSRPEYFKENQVDGNPLDAVDPYVAAALVTAHTRDGLQLAAKYRLPQEVQQIITEHHGDTPVMYFYNKALQAAGDRPVDIADFRYPGPRPGSREAGIVMLADTAEAAVRSIASPTPQAIRERIDTLVRGKLEDGQLSDCPMTMQDIEGVCEAFCKVLNGVFHERIEYPKTDIPQRGTFLSQEEPVQAHESEVTPAEFVPKPLVSVDADHASEDPAGAQESAAGKEPESRGSVGIWPAPPEDLPFTKENP